MKKINFKKVKEFSFKLLKYTTIVLVVLSSFFLGRYNGETNKEIEVIESFKTVNRNEVNIAIDERNNLIIIEKESGNYTIFEDSIGHSVFKLYARNIWTNKNKNND
jgi:hypothetical protein